MAKTALAYKVGFVLDGGLEKPDGVQQYILTLGKWLQSEGHEVRYIAAGEIAPGITNAVSLSRSMHVKSNGNALSIPLPASRKKLKHYLNQENFDLLHIQTPYSPMMGEQLILNASKSTAIVGTFHILPKEWYFDVGNRLLGFWCRRSLRRFDVMLSVSEPARSFAQKTFKIDSQVLPNVVESKKFSSAKPIAKYNDDCLTVLFLGRLVSRKGCQDLLSAVTMLLRKSNVPKFRVLVCGTGPLEDNLKKYVKHHKLESVVEFLGFISEEDKPRYYASADVTVFPSLGGESFGIVLIEAMSSGRSVVIAAANPGYRTVMNNKPDLLFSPGNVSELAGKLELYLNDANIRQKQIEWCVDRARIFDVEVIGKQLVDVYEQALRKHLKQ